MAKAMNASEMPMHIPMPPMTHMSPAQDKKMGKVMKEWKSGKLHSGSKKGPKVTSQKQAVAIALSEARKAKK